MWSKLQKQLYLLMDKDSKFQIHCSVYKTKSAWTAGQRSGISKSREAIPRYWITVGDNKDIIWDYPNNFIDKLPIEWYFHPDNYLWIADCLRYYIDTPKEKLLVDTYEKDKYGLTDILRKYDKRISKKIRENL